MATEKHDTVKLIRNNKKADDPSRRIIMPKIWPDKCSVKFHLPHDAVLLTALPTPGRGGRRGDRRDGSRSRSEWIKCKARR